LQALPYRFDNRWQLGTDCLAGQGFVLSCLASEVIDRRGDGYGVLNVVAIAVTLEKLIAVTSI